MAEEDNDYDIDDKFFVDPSNFQGHKYNQYKNLLMSKAMTTPSEYYELQTTVINQLNVKIAKSIYKQLFFLITKGKLPNGDQLKIGGTSLNPDYPSQSAADFCIDAANTIDSIISKATEIILPAKHLDIAKMQIEKKSNVSTIS